MFRAALLSLVLTLPLAARGQETWIEAAQWQIDPGAGFDADVMTGRPLAGTPVALPPDARFVVLPPQGQPEPVAIARPAAEGLYQVVRASKDEVIRYENFSEFQNFAVAADLTGLPAWHRARGLPDGPVAELCSRYDKALVAVGGGAGRDRVLGLALELTAMADPYTSRSPRVPVMLRWRGAPRPDAQIAVAERGPDGAVRTFTLRTDPDGLALLPVSPGHDYRLGALVMLAHLPDTLGGPAWHSYRASLTFQVPGT